MLPEVASDPAALPGVAISVQSYGARVIYYFQDRNDAIWMLTAYLKSEKADLTKNEIRDIAEIIKEIKGGLL